MQIFLNILLLVLGIVVVIYGGDIFVNASIRIGQKLKIPHIIIGATIVSLATTLPEFIVSTISASQGAYGLAVGNSIGSVICNTALICGLSLAIVPSVVKEKGIMKYLILLVAVIMLFLFSINKNVSVAESIVLFASFIVFIAINVVEAVKKTKQEQEIKIKSNDDQKINIEKKNDQDKNNDSKQETEEELKPQNIWFTVLLFIIGAGMIAGGAWSMVQGSTFLCSAIGISDALIGLTVCAVGTSLPELITTITAIKKKTASLGYGNIIGANILNITLITSCCGFIAGKNGLTLTNQNFIIDFPIAILVSILFVLPLIFKNKTYRWQGVTLLSIYAVYIIGSILLEVLKVQI